MVDHTVSDDRRFWLRSLLGGVIVIGVVLALVLAASFLVLAGFAGARQAYEPLSTAERGCESVFPPDGVDSPEWSSCVDRESGTSLLGAAFPDLVLALVAFLTGGSGILLLGRLFSREGNVTATPTLSGEFLLPGPGPTGLTAHLVD